MLKEINSIKNQAKKEIEKAKDLKDLDRVFKKYLGKKGQITKVLRSLKNLSKTKRAKTGKAANELKHFLKTEINQKAQKIESKTKKKAKKEEWIDITLPGKRIEIGHLHPLTQARREIENIFQLLGFSVIDGPEIETEWYNFDALNIPKDHPARDLWDTLYLKDGKLLRTHTSPNQVRFMEKNQPPLRIIVPGRTFRYEATDASHEVNFYQIEGLMVDRKGKVTIANYKAIIKEFLERFFGKPTKIRLRPSYFPFTVISFEMDVSCPICDEKGCSTCGNSGWVELMGAGMVHPNVFKYSGLNPQKWQGFAFGMGLERLIMVKQRIKDIRFFYNNDIRFLKQF